MIFNFSRTTAITATAASSQQPAEVIRQRGLIRRLQGPLVLTLLLGVFGIICWIERAPLLRSAANLWVVSDPVTPADAVVVLGGGEDMRPFIAADLYSKGFVPKILVSQTENGRAAVIGAVPSHTEVNRNVLRKLGVPDDAIEPFGEGNKSTWDEAISLKNWTKQHAIGALIIPVEPFFARRARWVFQREFLGTTVQIEVPSFDPPSGYRWSEWWKTDVGVVTFQNEVLKYFYYRLKY
jgi:uncharacterized SAM-binding protein YcdF (DUF218 family)